MTTVVKARGVNEMEIIEMLDNLERSFSGEGSAF